MDDLLRYMDIAVVSCFVFTFITWSAVTWYKRQRPMLDQLLPRSISAAGVPPGIALLALAVNPLELAQRVSGISIYLALAGCTLLFVSVTGALGVSTPDRVLEKAERGQAEDATLTKIKSETVDGSQ